MPFIHDDFLLSTDAAQRLYHGHTVNDIAEVGCSKSKVYQEKRKQGSD